MPNVPQAPFTRLRTLTDRTGPTELGQRPEQARHDLSELDGRLAHGTRITLSGQVFACAGRPAPGAVIEIWQPDAQGLFAHQADPRAAAADPNFLGWGRCVADANGWYRFRTIMPGTRNDSTGGKRLPHINLMLLASGIMPRFATTVFFVDELVSPDDPVLAAVPPALRPRLIAQRASELDRTTDEGYRFDIIIRGVGETPFFLD